MESRERADVNCQIIIKSLDVMVLHSRSIRVLVCLVVIKDLLIQRPRCGRHFTRAGEKVRKVKRRREKEEEEKKKKEDAASHFFPPQRYRMTVRPKSPNTKKKKEKKTKN